MKDEIEFNNVSFGLPVETFRVSAHIAMEERLPIVTEYVLRIIHACRQLTLVDVAEYFGFTNSEALALIESLSRQGLVSIIGEAVTLSQFSIERFDEAGGDHPKFSKVELKNDTVTFDLRSFTPLRQLRAPMPSDNIIKLDAEEDVLGSSLEAAKAAYRERYSEIASMRGDLREKSFGVYSVSDIESKSRSYLPIPVSFSISSVGHVSREMDSAFELIAPPDLVHFFNEEITGRIPKTLSLGAEGIDDFIETFNVQFMQRYLAGRKFDLLGYLTDAHFEETMNSPKGITPIAGNLYLAKNRDLIKSRLADRRQGRRQGKNQRGRILSSVAWMAPDYRLWGRGGAFAETVGEIRKTLAEQSKLDEVFIFAAADNDEEFAVTNRFRVNQLKELHFVRRRSGHQAVMYGRLELFLYPAGFVAVLFHASIPGSRGLLMPIGFISTSQQHIECAHNIFRQAAGSGRYAGKATFRAGEPHPEDAFEQACQFLQYDNIRGKRLGDDS